MLRHLRRCFLELEQAGARLPSPQRAIRRARSFRRWDALTVVPRFGFVDPDDYYSRDSAAAVLDRLRVPCLLVASEIDPVIPPRAIAPYLPSHATTGALCPVDLLQVSGDRSGREGQPAALTLLWHPTAGHVAFSGSLDLERCLLGWLAACP